MNLPNRADLHRHLDGSLRLTTVVELADKFGIELPENFYFKPNMTLDIALSYFATTLKLLQQTEELTRVAREICEDAAEEGVSHLEIRFGPQLHQQKGLALPDIVDAVLEGLDGRAGLILCGMYGEDPAVLNSFVDLARDRTGVVAIDIAGGPNTCHNFSLADYAGPYTRARELGIRRTVHASEGRDPQEIITAVTKLHAERLGHATTLLESDEALKLVIERGVTIEACPTSNHQCGVIPSVEKHPLAEWLDRGVKACLNTDNTFFSRVNSFQEHQNALGINGMDVDKLLLAIENGRKAAFVR